MEKRSLKKLWRNNAKANELGSVVVEAALSLAFVLLLLQLAIDMGQRIGHMSWFNQLSYLVSLDGGEKNSVERSYRQEQLLGTLLGIHNANWRLNAATSVSIQSNAGNTTRGDASAATSTSTALVGNVQGLWKTQNSAAHSSAPLRSINYLPPLTSTAYASPSNLRISSSTVLNYDCVGNLCLNCVVAPCP